MHAYACIPSTQKKLLQRIISDKQRKLEKILLYVNLNQNNDLNDGENIRQGNSKQLLPQYQHDGFQITLHYKSL